MTDFEESKCRDVVASSKLSFKTDLFFQGCILVFNIPSHHQTQGYSKIVCLNPSALLNCIAGILCETDPREYVPQFIKAGKLEMFWPTGARPNEWTLRAAIDDIVSKGFVRESVIPLCFQVRCEKM